MALHMLAATAHAWTDPSTSVPDPFRVGSGAYVDPGRLAEIVKLGYDNSTSNEVWMTNEEGLSGSPKTKRLRGPVSFVDGGGTMYSHKY